MLSGTRLVLTLLVILASVVSACRQGAPTTTIDHQTDTNKPNTIRSDTIEIVEEHWPYGKLRLRKKVLVASDGSRVNHGAFTRWHNNGQKEYEAVFVHGKKHGTTTRWHKNGQKQKQEQYLHGVKHGVSISWDPQGNKRTEEHHLDGKPHGTWTVWGSHGSVKAQSRFDHGTPIP